MGLDTTHNGWHGSYSAFHRWRIAVCAAAGYGTLDAYKGFDGATPCPDPETDALWYLLNHSDCDGAIKSHHCRALAKRLEELLPALQPADAAAAQQWIEGLRLAADRNEDVEFM